LAPDTVDPQREHWPRLRSTFSTDNDPVDSPQIDFANILKKRLDREEPNGRLHAPKVVDAWQSVFTIFN
jgi:hypothetical protein